jgi:hypothetical protein
MSEQSKIKVNGKEVLYPFRNLSNYKSIHAKRAASLGVGTDLQAAPTLTAARKVMAKKA